MYDYVPAPLFTPGYFLTGLCFAVMAWALATLVARRYRVDPANVAFLAALALCIAAGNLRKWEPHWGRQEMLFFAVPTALWVALLAVALSRVAGRAARGAAWAR